MNYVEISPTNEISSFVKCFWKYENKDKDAQYTIFPNGYFELFMIFEQQHLFSVFLSGLRTKPFEVFIPKGIIVSAIRFPLSASEYLFEQEICSIRDTTMPLDSNFWGLKKWENLSFEDRTKEISGKISHMLSEKEIDRKKLSLLQTVYSPDLTVKEIAEKILWDRRKINRYFNHQFGLSLKTFLNIIRLRNSFEALKKGTLYPDSNYYDQSHYIKEVKKYTGELPKDLSKNECDRFLQFSVNKKS